MISWSNNHKKNQEISYYEGYILNTKNLFILDYLGKPAKLNFLLTACEKDGKMVFRTEKEFKNISLEKTEKVMFTLRYSCGQIFVRYFLEEIQKALLSGAFINKGKLEYYNDRDLTIEIEKIEKRFKPFFHRDHKIFGEKVYDHDPIEELRGKIEGENRFTWRIQEAFTSFEMSDYGFLDLDFRVKTEDYYVSYLNGEIKLLASSLIDFLSEQITFKKLNSKTKVKELENCPPTEWWINFLREIKENLKEVHCFDHLIKENKRPLNMKIFKK